MNEYPRMLYHSDGRTETVTSEDHELEMAENGFGRDPHDVHRENNPAANPVEPSGQREFANLVADIVIEKLMATKPSDEPRRGPGRPRKDETNE